MPPSYNLVELPAEEEKAAAGAQDAAPPRPEAAVKGITPLQPAPTAREEAAPLPVQPEAPSIIGKILGWFKHRPEEPTTATAEARPVPQLPHRPRREGRPRGGAPLREEPRRDRTPGQPQRPRAAEGAPAQLESLNAAIMEAVNATGDVFLSHTKLGERYALRLAIGNLRTTRDDVAAAWELLRGMAARLG